MLPSYKIGKTRIELAEILTKFCGVHVSPALLSKNVADYRGGRNYGYGYSWFVDADISHPLNNCGSTITMKEFLKYCKRGYRIELSKEELFVVRSSQH